MPQLAEPARDLQIAAAYFEAQTLRASRPLIVGAHRTPQPRITSLFDQIAVLMAADTRQPRFSWIGPVLPDSAKRLRTANVGLFDSNDDAMRAVQLAPAWLFVAHAGGKGTSQCVIEAMAAGLAVVAADTPGSRRLVRDGESGYLCRSQAEMLDRISALIDTPQRCVELGQAARRHARSHR